MTAARKEKSNKMSTLQERVGYVGLGAMGSGMAASLLGRGVPLTVFNRTLSRTEPLKLAGANVAASPAELASNARVVFLSLPTMTEVNQVLFGSAGVAAALARDSVVIDTSSIAASDARVIAARLHDMGIHFLDAPVSGGPAGAAAGTLSCMVGGPEEIVERCRPLLEAIAKTIVHVGGHGAGQLCKTCAQICVVASMLGAAEAVALCLKADVDPLRMREALLGGSARSTVLENHVLRLLQPPETPAFRATLLRKDLRVALDTLRALGVFAPTTALAEQLFSAFIENGHGDEDWPRIGSMLQELSGLPSHLKA
jgi:2-hydroxy-3-oxopropionate reductase